MFFHLQHRISRLDHQKLIVSKVHTFFEGWCAGRMPRGYWRVFFVMRFVTIVLSVHLTLGRRFICVFFVTFTDQNLENILNGFGIDINVFGSFQESLDLQSQNFIINSDILGTSLA